MYTVNQKEVRFMNVKEEQLFIRIQKIEFKDFRNIEHGSISFPNSKPLTFRDGAPSVLGLYGQNGSGKTSAIMALGILKDVLSGNAVGNRFLSCVREGCERCSLSFTFSAFTRIVDDKEEAVFSNNMSSCFELFYDFDLVKAKEQLDGGICNTKNEERLCVENEILKYKVIEHDAECTLGKRVMFDARKSVSDDRGIAFGSKKSHDLYCLSEKDANEFKIIKAVAMDSGKSFLFSHKFRAKIGSFIEKVFKDDIDKMNEYALMNDVENEADFSNNLQKFKKGLSREDDNSILIAIFHYFCFQYKILERLALFGRTYLQVIDTTTTGLTNLNTTLPLLIWQHTPGSGVYFLKFSLNMDSPTYVSEKYFGKISEVMGYISNVLNKLVPDMELSLTDLGIRINQENIEEHCFEIMSNRGGHTIPLKYESDGIRRMVSVLSLLIAAYNEESFTIAIDEIDSGIFEYLLGELLEVMATSMKGQFIFTAHNLRPLEVLPSKYLCFTTPNKECRFTTINKRGNSNLRDTYFRNIILGTTKESVYNPTDKYEIELALYQAGHPESDNLL